MVLKDINIFLGANKMKKILLSILLVVSLLMTSCGSFPDKNTEEFKPTSLLSKNPLANETILKDSLKKRMHNNNLFVGAAVGENFKDKKGLTELLPKHFNQIVCENELKPATILVPGSSGGYKGYTYNFEPAKVILDFAKEHNMKVHAHVLVWFQNAQEIQWFFKDASGKFVSREEMLARLEKYMNDVMTYCWTNYPEVINGWDVVNEAVKNDNLPPEGNYTWDSILRTTDTKLASEVDLYRLTIGDDYVIQAFKLATKVLKSLPDSKTGEKAVDNIKLFYNDYGSEYNSQKRLATKWLLQQLRAENDIIINGFGVQNHVAYEAIDTAAYRALFNLYNDWDNFEIRLSETDMSVKSLLKTTSVDEALILQAKKFEDVFDVVAEFPTLITSITFWGTTDDLSWMTYDWEHGNMDIRVEDYPLLFDSNCKEKPAFWAITNPTKYKKPAKQFNSYPMQTEDANTNDDVWTYQNFAQLQGDLDASFSVLWNSNISPYWYVYVKVSDKTKDDLDRIKLYVDSKNDGGDTLKDDDKIITIKRTDHGIVETDNGYEVIYKLDSGEKIDAGTVMGFDVVAIDNDGKRASAWNDITFSQDTAPANYGKIAAKRVSKLAKAVKGTPTIDAEVDNIWENANIISISEMNKIGKPNLDGQFRTMWDDGYFYILAEIADPKVTSTDLDQKTLEHNSDSIEIFLDQDNMKSESYLSDDCQYRISANNSQSFKGENCKPENIESASKITENAFDNKPGYIIEAKIKLTAIQPSANTIIGFDFQINDDGTGTGKRTGQLTWSDKTNTAYLTPSVFGLLRFVE
jgi:endo-1,4-beta-xylanase